MHRQLHSKILPSKPDNLFGPQAGKAMQGDQGTIASGVSSALVAGLLDDTMEISDTECRTTPPTTARCPGYERPGGVPAHGPASRQERVERDEVRGRITAERAPQEPDEPLHGA
jgi:hypothetical protein